MPSRRSARAGTRIRIAIGIVVLLTFILATSLRGIAGFWTDLLWFDSLGYRGVFTGILGAKIVLAALASAAFFVLLWLNLFLADRLAPRFRPAGPEEELIERYQQLIGNRTWLVRLAVSLVFGLVAGVGVSGQWKDWLLFTNARDFGVVDPLFKTDVGFYVFKLPFLTFLVDWAFASIVVMLLVTAAAHYLNGGIRLNVAGPRVSPQVKAHLSVLLGVLALLKAAGYWLARYELNFSHRGAVDGATYTDVKAQLPALHLLLFISGVAFVLLIVNIWRRGWVLPVLAVGLWGFIAVVVGGIYPSVIQRLQVEPAESSKERPYIARNIGATQAALGLDKVKVKEFAADDKLDAAALAANAGTVRNIRLWDPKILLTSYQKLQETKSYYAISDVDVDRYQIDGQTTQVMTSVRNLHTDGLTQASWESRHLIYTHGYGAVAAPSNAKNSQGQPDLLLRDVPVEATDPSVEINKAGIYFGENLSGFVIVDTKRRELEYAQGNGNKLTSYTGKDGIRVDSPLRRAAFFLRFGDRNTLFTGNIQSNSKILIKRDIRDRVESLAPFLSFDADPYPVIIGGRVQWIIDGYTTTSRYPYAQRADVNGLGSASGLQHGFNYARNSVKAVVDAYDGTTTLYAVDEKDPDPILSAYRAAFPKLFTDGSKIPAELRAHFRYPEDLFRVQTNMWGRYHIEDADAFYAQNDAWDVAPDPDLPGSTSALNTTTSLGAPVSQVTQRTTRMEPYYLLMRLPGEQEEDFLLLRPFVPISNGDTQRLLTGFMVAKSNPAQYGQLEVFVMPRSNLPDGPRIVASVMQANEAVAQYQTFQDQAGSKLRYGNLIITPIEQSLLYVRPVYVQSESDAIPTLQKVITYYAGKVVLANTLQEALATQFGSAPDTGEGATTPTTTPGAVPALASVTELLGKAAAAFKDADAALKAGDLGLYQQKVKEGAGDVDQARSQTSSPSSTAPKSSTTTTTTARRQSA
jgi:uncharacterized membrane protein (UPF0182 family)